MFKSQGVARDKASVNRVAATVAYSVIGLALLSTGGTYAAWNATASANTTSVIQTSSLKIEAVDAGVWADTSIAGSPEVITDMNLARPMMQGNSYQFRQRIKTSTSNMKADVKVDLPWVDDRMLVDMEIVVTVQNAAGDALVTNRISRSALSSGTVSLTVPAQAGDDKEGYIQIDLIFAANAANAAGDSSTLSINDAVITLVQVIS